MKMFKNFRWLSSLYIVLIVLTNASCNIVGSDNNKESKSSKGLDSTSNHIENGDKPSSSQTLLKSLTTTDGDPKGGNISNQEEHKKATTVQIDATSKLEIIDIKAFGAKGDGISDDSRALENALNSIENNDGGKVAIHFPKGEYALGVEVNVDNIVLTGEGTIVPIPGERGNVLILTGNRNRVEGLAFYEKTFASNLLTIRGDNNVVAGCNFDGPRRSSATDVVYSDRMLLIDKTNGIGNVIQHCTINNGRIGAGLMGSYQLLDSEISNCIMGVWAAPSTRNSEIARNIIRDNNVSSKSGADGILAHRNVKDLHIHHNKIFNSGEHGIYFQGDNSLINDNEVFSNNGSGIKLASYTTLLFDYSKSNKPYVGNNNTVKNNRCYDNCKGAHSTTNAGIYLQAPLRDITVVGNVCYGNYYGIRSTSVAKLKPDQLAERAILRDIEISGNNATGNEGYSFYIEGETGIVIEDNVIDDLLTNSKSPDDRIVEPVIRQNEIRGTLLLNRAKNAILEDNEINKLNVNTNSVRSSHKLKSNKIKSSNIKQ